MDLSREHLDTEPCDMAQTPTALPFELAAPPAWWEAWEGGLRARERLVEVVPVELSLRIQNDIVGRDQPKAPSGRRTVGIFGRIWGRGKPSLAELSKEELSQLEQVLPDPGDWLEKEGKLDLASREMLRGLRKPEGLAFQLLTGAALRAYGEGMVPILESLVERQPNKWLYWYKLGEFAFAIKDYIKAIRAYEQAFQLRPSDPRSTYGLACVYQEMAEGGYSIKELEQRGLVFGRFLKATPSYRLRLDTPAAKKALKELGLTVEQAAERAIAMYRETLELGVRRDEVGHVEECLDVMGKIFAYTRLPGTWSKGS